MVGYINICTHKYMYIQQFACCQFVTLNVLRNQIRFILFYYTLAQIKKRL